MKKQLLIAAVAASMNSVAMADVSISGAYEGTALTLIHLLKLVTLMLSLLKST